MIIKAQAEKESADLMRQSSAKGNGFVQLRKIEACKVRARESCCSMLTCPSLSDNEIWTLVRLLQTIAETLSRSRNVAYLPSSGGGGR